MELLKFIESNPDWKEKIQLEPYCVKVEEDETYVLLKYDQIHSDFNIPLVRECRGIILTKDTHEVVCHPFDKFGNYGEGYCPEIDWATARVQSKIDGSIIKVWYHNFWHVSSNGMIDAGACDLSLPFGKYKTLGDLFSQAFFYKHKKSLNDLNKDYTYMFELISPYNRVVIPYAEIDIYHIGTRDMKSDQELVTDIGIQRPKEFNLHTLEDVIAAAKVLPFNDEGYVVVDGKWNRAKIKSPAYVAVHHLRGEGNLSYKRVLTLIMSNEHTEFLNYFPEYVQVFSEVEEKYKDYLEKLLQSTTDAIQYKALPRKEYAMWATKQVEPAFLFQFLDGKIKTAAEYLEQTGPEKVAKKLGY
jgi:hypothetical protein